MSCEDIPSLLDLQNTKKHADDFGRLMGTGEDDSTNGVTGQVRPTYNKVMKSVGFKPGSGDFTTGFTVMPGERNIAWYDPVSKNWYSYLGVIPTGGYPVSPGTNPVGNNEWKTATDQLLRNDLKSTHGATLVGTSSGENVEQALSSRPATAINAHNNDASAHPQLSSFITAEANRAKQAADAASLSGDVYPDTASGLASTTNGKYFSVVSTVAEGYLDLYRNNAGLAAFQKTYPSSALVKRLDDGFNKLTGSNGFSADGGDGMSTIEVPAGEKKALVIGTGTKELMAFDTDANDVKIPASSLKSAKVTSRLTAGESTEDESENTEDLVRSEKAKVIGDALHSLIFDTVKGELISTFKIVDNSQNPGTSFSDEIPSMITGIPAGYEESNRKYQAIPTIARSGSRFWAAWWADKNGAGENHGNFFVIGYSDDNCKTFTQSHILTYPANNNHKLLDPMLWKNPESGEVWLFFTSMSKPGQIEDGLYGCWCTVLENPNAQRGFSWSLPVKYRNIGDPRRPVRIGGKWMQCVDVFRVTIQPIYPETAGCEFVEFDPRTKSTVNIGHNTPNNNGAYGGYFETELIQRMDGSLMSTTRGASPVAGILWRSFSYDGGKTWSAQEAYTALGTVASSRIWLGRLPSGRLLIVYNASTNRKAMTIKLSEDDGETWPYSVVLEGADSPHTVSYPIVAVDGDDIYTIYDYGRDVANEIRVTVVKESGIIAGTAVPDINIISSAHVG